MARAVDPRGERTFGVVTKIDLMDEGTDALELLQGEVYPLKLGYIGVICRSQKDILDKKTIGEALQGEEEFNEMHSQRVFRIMASDYAASTLLPSLLRKINEIAPNVTIDIMTPSDVTFHDVEAGKIDMAINRFDELPQSFHQKTIWRDSFSCLLSADNPDVTKFNLNTYLSSKHVWVSKTGFGVGVGMDPKDVQKLGWVDEALARLGKKRDIKVFTRNYHVAMQLAYEDGLIATLPTKAALLHKDDHKYTIVSPPFDIPEIELKMIWSPLLHHDASHIWFRQLVIEAASQG